jgi:beta-galactosidase
MTEKRETTGAAAKLLMAADRREISSDGEDVAMFTVAVHDAKGRLVPITDNEVSFRVSGSGRLIGVGNGDPTDQESDKGTSRKAFSGLCMAIVQSTKAVGDITVEATSPGLASATVTIAARGATPRPQVATWEREVPTGAGITGLWRPVPATGSELQRRNDPMVFTLRQAGSDLTGTVEGASRSFSGGSDVPAPITEGKVDGDRISFKVPAVAESAAA